MIKDKKIYYATHPEARAMKNKQDLEWKKRNHEKVKARRVRYDNTFHGRVAAWRNNAKTRHIEWALSDAYLESIPKSCFFTGVELTCEQKKSNTISLDRIDSSKGYVEGNVVFCCSEINIMKNKMDYDYFIKICESILQHTSRIAFHSK